MSEPGENLALALKAALPFLADSRVEYGVYAAAREALAAWNRRSHRSEQVAEEAPSKCSTCKHWEAPRSEYGEVPGVGRCAAVVQLWDAAEWSADGESRRLLPQHSHRIAFVKDGSDYRADLLTMGSFGCVQHEPAAAIERAHHIGEAAGQPEGTAG